MATKQTAAASFRMDEAYFMVRFPRSQPYAPTITTFLLAKTVTIPEHTGAAPLWIFRSVAHEDGSATAEPESIGIDVDSRYLMMDRLQLLAWLNDWANRQATRRGHGSDGS
jgi:hypothetical protein